MSDWNLNAYEARVLAVLVEKELTTPEHYPLSLNALTAGCNQKSNRHPVVNWLEDEVYVALTGLLHKRLVGRVQPAGRGVEKYRHNAASVLGLECGPLAVLAELMMRGPQTAGLLRGRVHRMVPVPTQAELGVHLAALEARGLVERLPPEPGARAGRWAETLVSGPRAESEKAPLERPEAGAARLDAPPADLEARVAALEAEVRSLRELLEGLA